MAKSKEEKAATKQAVKNNKKAKQQIKAQRKKAKEGAISKDEEEIETLLKQYETSSNKAIASVAYGKLTPCEQPSPRVSCSLTALPSR